MIPGYNIPLRKDRVGSRGGGVAMYIADYLPYVRKYEFDCPGLELLWVELILNKFKILCGVCYRAPNSSASQINDFFVYFRTA